MGAVLWCAAWGTLLRPSACTRHTHALRPSHALRTRAAPIAVPVSRRTRRGKEGASQGSARARARARASRPSGSWRCSRVGHIEVFCVLGVVFEGRVKRVWEPNCLAAQLCRLRARAPAFVYARSGSFSSGQSLTGRCVEVLFGKRGHYGRRPAYDFHARVATPLPRPRAHGPDAPLISSFTCGPSCPRPRPSCSSAGASSSSSSCRSCAWRACS